MPKPRVLCFASYYRPGFRAGGPIRSLGALCDWLGDDFEFGIVTRNHDLGVAEPYASLASGGWREQGRARVHYLAAPYGRPGALRRVVAEFGPDLLYFHSVMDPAISITPLVLRRMGWLGTPAPAVVAPRGEFSAGALGLKRLKKAAWLACARLLGVYRDVTWQATDASERRDIARRMGEGARVVVAPNLPPRGRGGSLQRADKRPGSLRLVFLSRISPMKNLTGALESLAAVRAPVTLDIYGTREDAAYWAECEARIARLPANVRAAYRGEVAPERVLEVLAAHDALLLPSLGENFGHVILEALVAGCPVILSDRTPWRGLAERGVGFDVPLQASGAVTAAIERLAGMDGAEFGAWSARARQFGQQYCDDASLVRANLELLQIAMRRSSAG